MADGYAPETAVGWVKWYDAKKGYGFVVPNDGRPDVLVHANCLRAHGLAMLRAADVVSCVVRSRPRGLEAVQLIEVRRRGVVVEGD